jgi:hypothetical protein
MRIKLFEMFRTDDYYQEISRDEWNYFTPLSIKKSSIDKIMKVFPSIYIDDYYLRSYSKGIVVRIYESEDEYFYVYYLDNSRYGIKPPAKLYKCDQIEGLFKLLKDKDII